MNDDLAIALHGAAKAELVRQGWVDHKFRSHTWSTDSARPWQKSRYLVCRCGVEEDKHSPDMTSWDALPADRQAIYRAQAEAALKAFVEADTIPITRTESAWIAGKLGWDFMSVPLSKWDPADLSAKLHAFNDADVDPLLDRLEDRKTEVEAARVQVETKWREAVEDFFLECEISMDRKEGFRKIAWILTGGQTGVYHQVWFNRIVRDLESLEALMEAGE